MQESNVFITIIIPAYQVENYIEECVDSLLRLSVNKEILIVVDSWKDPTVQVCKKYVNLSLDVKLILNDDKGMSEARNTGLRIARGKYIWFVDADDYVCENYSAFMWNKLQEYSPEILMFDAGVVDETSWEWDENNYIRRDKIDQAPPFSGIEFFQQYYVKDAYRTPVWLNVFSKEFLKFHKLLFLKNYAHEDEDFTFRAMIKAKKVVYMGEILYIRRYRLASAMTSGFHEKQIRDFFQIMQENTRFIQNICNTAFQKVYDRYLYDRINLLIDRIEISDIVDKTEWYQMVVKYFYEYILKYNNKDLGGLLMSLEVVSHARSVKPNSVDCIIFDKELEDQLFICWQKGIEDKIRNYTKNKEGYYLGIYGTGRHTEWLFPIYVNIADKEEMKLIFIVSQKESNIEYFMDYKIVNIRDIDIKTVIVVSSFFSQNEICETIRKLNVPCTIIKIYE